MSNILAKVGKLDNVSLYQHVCDTTSDLENIPETEITLGSTAIVIDGDKGFEAYMANSDKEWKPLVTMSGGGNTPADDGQVNPGYSVETEEIVVLDKQVVGFKQYFEEDDWADIDYDNYEIPAILIPSDVETLNVTLDGVNYKLPRVYDVDDWPVYGELDDNGLAAFEHYPILILTDGYIVASLTLADNQPHTLSISYSNSNISVSPEFKQAVQKSLWTESTDQTLVYENSYPSEPFFVAHTEFNLLQSEPPKQFIVKIRDEDTYTVDAVDTGDSLYYGLADDSQVSSENKISITMTNYDPNEPSFTFNAAIYLGIAAGKLQIYIPSDETIIQPSEEFIAAVNAVPKSDTEISPIQIFDAVLGDANSLEPTINACLTNGSIPVLRYNTDSQMMTYRNFFYYFAGYEIKNYSIQAYRFTQIYNLNTAANKDLQIVRGTQGGWTLEFVTDNETTP